MNAPKAVSNPSAAIQVLPLCLFVWSNETPFSLLAFFFSPLLYTLLAILISFLLLL